MSKHDNRVRLQHMLDAAREAVALTHGKTRFDLDTERLLNLGLVRLLEIIGEAANRVSDDDYGLYPEIPWGQIVSLRNRLIHGYDSVDFDILWRVVQDDLPDLIQKLENILQ